jgi:NTP pyrophosphatase (non-canonical NTP hydrolase)
MNILELREKAMSEANYPESYIKTSKDPLFLIVALFGETGELANLCKKRWRDGVQLLEEIRDEIADIRIYLELLAACYDITGNRLTDMMKFEIAALDVMLEKELIRKLCVRVGMLVDVIDADAPKHPEAPVNSVIRVHISRVVAVLEATARYFDIGGEKLYARIESKLSKVSVKIKMLGDRTIINNKNYPSHYLPGHHWALDEAWAIVDEVPSLNALQRDFLAALISGTLMKHKGRAP